MWKKTRYISMIVCILFMTSISFLHTDARVITSNGTQTTVSIYRPSIRYRRQQSTRKTIMVVSVVLCMVAEGIVYWRYRNMKQLQIYDQDHKIDEKTEDIYIRVKEIFYYLQEIGTQEPLDMEEIHLFVTHEFYHKLVDSQYAYINVLKKHNIKCIKIMEEKALDHEVLVCVNMEEYVDDEWKWYPKEYWVLHYQGDILMLSEVKTEI